MAKFRKKPVVIEAIQYDGNNMLACLSFAKSPEVEEDFLKEGIAIKTREGVMLASPGDWIIRGIKGELYPCKPDIFAETYEPVEQPPTEPEGVKRG